MDDSSYQQLLDEIAKADAVIVGIGPDLSEAAGLALKGGSRAFDERFSDFANDFFLRSIEQGERFKWTRPENKWAFTARLLQYLRDSEPGQPYADLVRLLEGKEFFALTPNSDGLAARALGDERVAMLRGDYRWLQCEKGCTDRVYPSEGYIDELVANTSGCAIPSELVPTCPECGRPLTPWVYGYEFLEGEHHKQQFEHWNAFLEKNINSKIVFLQVGAGMKNQEYLKLPFWNMTMQHPDAFYVAIEKQAAFAPPEIEDKALTFEGDIAAILHRAASLE